MAGRLDTSLPAEMARVRDLVLPVYLELGAEGAFAVALMRADLDRAAKAMIEGDLVTMIEVYTSLKAWSC